MNTKSTEVGVRKAPRTTLAWLLASFFGVGFLRPGPGTWASACTALLWWAASSFLAPPAIRWFYCILAACIVITVGIHVSTIVARESGVADPGYVVIDEVAGQLIAMIMVPHRWKYILASFILFRGFDILKPPPLRQLERLPEGSGIMLDDVGAGVYANIVVQLLFHFQVLR